MAAALLVGGGLALFFVLAGGDGRPALPKGAESPILEQAKREGVISGYRALPAAPYGTWKWIVDGDEIELGFPNACGESSGPCTSPPLLIVIDYRHTAGAQAAAIARIARRWANRRRFGHKILLQPYYP